MVDVALSHLDRPFDYVVPAELDDAVTAGTRVRVRFAGRLVDGFVLERVEASEHGGTLAFVERAVGEPVLTAETARLFRAVADRYAGSFVDVLRLGVPARHARAEAWTERLAEAVQAALAGGRGAIVVVPDMRDLARLDAALLAALGEGRHVALSADLGPAERYRRWLAV